jgi:hypothetical protein
MEAMGAMDQHGEKGRKNEEAGVIASRSSRNGGSWNAVKSQVPRLEEEKRVQKLSPCRRRGTKGKKRDSMKKRNEQARNGLLTRGLWSLQITRINSRSGGLK